ncbi:hypothetical protein ACLOJK_013269 [Asimina triloba]
MAPRKVTHRSSSSDTEQLTQLPKHEGEDLIEDPPSPPEPSTFPLQALAPPTIARAKFVTLLEMINVVVVNSPLHDNNLLQSRYLCPCRPTSVSYATSQLLSLIPLHQSPFLVERIFGVVRPT